MTEPGFVLALETSQRSQSIAIRLHDGVVHEEVVHAEDRAQEDLLPAVARTVERSGCTPEQLRGVILNAGPGGFTGLRLAHAAAHDACWVALASKGDETWIALADGADRVEGRSIGVGGWEPGVCRTLIADEHLPKPWIDAVSGLGIRRLPLRVHASAVLAAGLPALEQGRFVPPEALVPAYPREAEAVRLWRLRKAGRADGSPV